MLNINKKGFTLVELMVAITIVAILAVVGFTVFSGLQKGARDTRRTQEIQSISTAMETHYLAVGGTCPTNSGGSANLTSAAAPSYCMPVDAWFNKSGTGNAGVSVDPTGTTSYCMATSATSLPATPTYA